MNTSPAPQGRYAPVNGLDLYYEIHGKGLPLVLVHGGGSTITSTFGRILPQLATRFRLIAVELQAHGHTADRPQPLSFEQDADDIAALLRHLSIPKASFFGFSNGGTTCLQLGIRHGDLVDKLVVASATYKRSGLIAGFFDGFDQAELAHMPALLQEAYLQANPDRKGLQRMFERDVERMKHFTDIPDEQLQQVKAPVLVINGSREPILPEHALELSRILPQGALLIVPGGHGDYIGEICTTPDDTLTTATLSLVQQFLEES